MKNIQDKKVVAVIDAFLTMEENTVPGIHRKLTADGIDLLQSTVSNILDKYLKNRTING
tara:strand:+ start:669 stop:845 length:177 start_codon:yes stop_codon:yes gene_type:complete